LVANPPQPIRLRSNTKPEMESIMTTLSTSEIGSLMRMKRRRERFWGAISSIISGTIIDVITSLAGGFELMLAVGIIHAEWIPALPTVGYWWACLVVLLLRGTFSRTQPADKSK